MLYESDTDEDSGLSDDDDEGLIDMEDLGKVMGKMKQAKVLVCTGKEKDRTCSNTR